MGSSFLFLMAAMTSGLKRSPQSGEMAVSSWTANPSVNHRGTRWPVAVRVYTWLISCHNVDAQWAQSRHAQRAHGEILVVRVDLHLHRLFELEPVLLLVGGDGAIHLGLEV